VGYGIRGKQHESSLELAVEDTTREALTTDPNSLEDSVAFELLHDKAFVQISGLK